MMASVRTVSTKVASNGKGALARAESRWGFWFLIPSFIVFILFQLIPVVLSFYYSLTNFDGISSPEFVGVQNYVKVLNNREFWLSFMNTCYFTIGTVVLGVALALVFAVMLNKKIKGQSVLRAFFFVPYVVSFVAAAMVWQWMLQPDYGLINSFLRMLGLPQPLWLASTTWSMPAVILMSVWKGLGYNIVLILAGLQSISTTVYEAAVLDGAGEIKIFFKITLPLLKNILLFVILTAVINGLQAFDQIYIMTGGGPLKSTQTVVYLIYQNAFSFYKQGYASAMSYMLFVVIFIFSCLLMKVTRSGE